VGGATWKQGGKSKGRLQKKKKKKKNPEGLKVHVKNNSTSFLGDMGLNKEEIVGNLGAEDCTRHPGVKGSRVDKST